MLTFAWYAPYVLWAEENDIISGASEHTLEPTRLVTREEMAVILHKFVQVQNLVPTEKQTTEFVDSALISAWAKPSVDAIRHLGLMSGKSEGRFDPKGTATCSELKSILPGLNALAK